MALSPLRLDRATRDDLVAQLQQYMQRELQQELGSFDAGFLLDFVAGNLGAHCYNQGVRDAQAVLTARMDDLADALYQLEQPTGGR